MEFNLTEGEGSVASGGVGAMLAPHIGLIAQIAALAVAAVVVGLFILRPILSARPAALPELAQAEGEQGLLLDASGADDLGGDASYESGQGDGELADFGGEDSGDFGFGGGSPMGGFLPAPIGGEDDLRAQVDAAIAAKPEKAIEILADWLDAADEAREKEGAAA